jgi:two-component system chemotaxis response regulator CheB
MVVAIGASTGGVEALSYIIQRLPADFPATLVTQHMPEFFTSSFAQRLDKLAAVTVMEAPNANRALPGHVYIAPGNRHLRLTRSGANYVCTLSDEAPVSNHRPSVDVLFSSVAKFAAHNAVGVILTGMGKDGAQGLASMRQAGARTIGQDEQTCVVYGMPKVAFEVGGVETQLSLENIPEGILELSNATSHRAVRV